MSSKRSGEAASTNRSTHDRLLSLQKKIHRSLQQQATRLLGEMPEAIRRYEREYREDFKRIPKRPNIVPKDELIREIRKCDVTLIGDYHTFAQAQRTALRVLRESVQKGETWYLGLEMIPSHRQESLDRFQLGQLSEAHFLDEIGYEDEWGFPWQNYAPIIHWAIRNRVRLIALNRPSELRRPDDNDQNELHVRDRWASGIITDVLQAARAARIKRPRMIVLYGELHIGKRHLPLSIKEVSAAALKRPLRTLILHQNQDTLYWRVASQGKELEAQVIRLRSRSYCVLSSPPWAKWQSVINWAEGSLPSSRPGSGALSNAHDNTEELDESDDRDEIDPLSLMTQYAGIVSEFFDLPKPSFDGLDVYTIRNADFSESLESSKLSVIEKRLVRYHVLHHHRVYLPSAPLAYLAAPSENGAAEIASIHLLRSALESHQASDPSIKESSRRSEKKAAVFYQWILEQSFGFLGSLVLNPKRKCDLIADHENRIKELKKGASPAFPHEQDARELACLILSSSGDSSNRAGNKPGNETEFQKKLDELLKRPALIPALYFAARYVGFAYAKQIHRSLLDETIHMDELRKIYLGEPETPLAPTFWRFQALRNAASKSPIGASKTETL